MKILFGVFELGLGHATRCTPLIETLLKKNEVHIISTGRALKVLKENFGNRCIYYDFPGVHSYYNCKFFKTYFVFALPKILKSIKKARKKSAEIIKKGKFDIVISDCRYDVYDTPENSYLINHQLRFKTPFFIERIAEKWLHSKMKNYKYVLVPDFPEENLSGRLSHNLRYMDKEKIKYIGILSHLKKSNVKKDIDILISVSGPEKTRVELLNNIFAHRHMLKGRIVIAGGNPDKNFKHNIKNITFHTFLNSRQQEEIMNRAKFVVIRAGYTTIMELAELDLKSLLIPSPGQTEQEYLGQYLERKGYFHHAHQRKFDFDKDVAIARKFRGFSPPWKTKDSVRKFMEIINKV